MTNRLDALEGKASSPLLENWLSAEVADYHEPTQRVRTTFLTNYPDVEAFGLGIGRLMEQHADEAVLKGR